MGESLASYRCYKIGRDSGNDEDDDGDVLAWCSWCQNSLRDSAARGGEQRRSGEEAVAGNDADLHRERRPAIKVHGFHGEYSFVPLLY